MVVEVILKSVSSGWLGLESTFYGLILIIYYDFNNIIHMFFIITNYSSKLS